jgi:hypothetical protein
MRRGQSAYEVSQSIGTGERGNGSASPDFRTRIQDHGARWTVYDLSWMAGEVGALTPALNYGCRARGVSRGAEVRVWSEIASRVTLESTMNANTISGDAGAANARVQPLTQRFCGMPLLNKGALGR